ncbi:MAG: DUF975 family protein [Lachnospiraceae bacterium]|nr:DUF975 family protein [Lachnospiraceae bacterium]
MDSFNRYKSSAELKAIAKEHMFGRYGTAIGALLAVFSITMFVSFFSTVFIDTTKPVGLIFNLVISFAISLLAGIFTSGEKYFYLKITCGHPVTVSDVFYGFHFFPDKALLIQLFLSICIYLSMMPMTILSYMVAKNPKDAVLTLIYSLSIILYGIVTVILTLFYSQAFYLLHDFPNYSAKELLTMSRRLMIGSKGRLFYLMVSFLPLFLLGMLSCGIAYLWLVPYVNATMTEFFLDLVKNQRPMEVNPYVK